MDSGRNSKILDVAKSRTRTRRHSVVGELTPESSLSPSQSDEKTLPNYLRSSSSSCHDFCKYGKKHGSEDDPKYPFLRKGKSLVPHEKQSQTNNLNLEEKKKKLRSLSERKINFSDSPKVIKLKPSPLKEAGLSMKLADNKIETPSVTKKSETKDQANLLLSSKNGNSSLERTNSGIRKKQEPKREAKSKVSDQNDSSNGTGDVPEKSNGIKKIVNSPLHGANSSGKDSKKTLSKSRTLPVKSQSFSGRSLTLSMTSDSFVKSTISSKSVKAEAVRYCSSLSNSIHKKSVDGEKTSKSKVTTKFAEKKVLKPSTSSRPQKEADRESLSLKSRKPKPDRDNLSVKSQESEKTKENESHDEKTLYVVEMKTKEVDSVSQHNSIETENANIKHGIEKMPMPANCDKNSPNTKSMSLENPVLYHSEQNSTVTDEDNLNFLEPTSQDVENNVQLNSHEEMLFIVGNGDLNCLQENLQELDNVFLDSAPKECDDYLNSLDKESLDMGYVDLNSQVQDSQTTENAEMNYIEEMPMTSENANFDHLNNEVREFESEGILTEEKPDDDQSVHSISTEDDKSQHSFSPDDDQSKLHSQSDDETAKEKPEQLLHLTLSGNDQPLHLASPDNDQSINLTLLDDDQSLNSISPDDDHLVVHSVSDNEATEEQILHSVSLDGDQSRMHSVSDNGTVAGKIDPCQPLHLVLPHNEQSLDLVSHDGQSLHSDSSDDHQSLHSLSDNEEDNEDSEDEYSELSELDEYENELTESDEYLQVDNRTQRTANDTILNESSQQSNHDGAESNHTGESSKAAERKSKRTIIADPKESDPTPRTLSFRRGKIIDLQTESTSPKRLRFRRRKIVNDGANGGQVGRKSYRRSQIDDPLDDDLNSDARLVQLRHQDVQEKKDAQGLFNNVIEETASKLVEARKSKVKALVGAFETVISLQDTKPASTA